MGISSAHFSGQGWLKNGHCTWTPTIPLNEILVENSTYLSTSKLKKRLLRDGIFERKCACCGLESWRGEPAPLVLYHINGNNRDNRIENLRLLCGNCNMQTPTFCRKKKKAG
jgi:hypothetical protein